MDHLPDPLPRATTGAHTQTVNLQKLLPKAPPGSLHQRLLKEASQGPFPQQWSCPGNRGINIATSDSAHLAGLFLSYFGALFSSHKLKFRAWNRVAAVYSSEGRQRDRVVSADWLPAKLSLHEQWLNIALTWSVIFPALFISPESPTAAPACLLTQQKKEKPLFPSLLLIFLEKTGKIIDGGWWGSAAVAYPAHLPGTWVQTSRQLGVRFLLHGIPRKM